MLFQICINPPLDLLIRFVLDGHLLPRHLTVLITGHVGVLFGLGVRLNFFLEERMKKNERKGDAMEEKGGGGGKTKKARLDYKFVRLW